MHDNISAHLQYQNISAQLQHICSTFAAPEHFSAIVAHLQHVCSTFATYLQNQNISAQLQHIYNTFSACLQHICSTVTFQHICSTFQHNCSTFQHILFFSSVTKLGLRFGLPKGSPNQKLLNETEQLNMELLWVKNERYILLLDYITKVAAFFGS